MGEHTEYSIGLVCQKMLAIEIERLFNRSLRGDAPPFFNLRHCFVERKEGGNEAMHLVVHANHLEVPGQEKRPVEFGRDFWVDSYCRQCGSVVYTGPSDRADSDYRWCCSNYECDYGKHLYFTGDQDPPAWTRPLPKDIGKTVDRQERIQKGLLQRLYERGVNFKVEVQEENGVVHQRILQMELLNKESFPVAHVLSDDMESAERWLINRVQECDPAMIEDLQKELKDEEAHAR